MKKILYLVCLFSLSLAAKTFTIHLDIDDVNLSQIGTKTEIQVAGFSTSTVDGYILPSRSFTYILSRAEKPVTISVTSMKTMDFAGMYDISSSTVDPNTQQPGYTLPSTPVSIVGSGYQNGASLVTVSFCPVVYNPVTRHVSIITEVTFDIQTEASTMHACPQISWNRDYDDYISLLRGNVQNPEDVSANAPIWSTVTSPFLVPLSSSSIETVDPVVMVTPVIIIVPASVVSGASTALNDFMQYERKTGRPLVWCTYEEIYAQVAGANNVEKIRNFLRTAHYGQIHLGGVVYTGLWAAVFFGDATASGLAAYLTPVEGQDDILSDYYFAGIDADPARDAQIWDADGDGHIGEIAGASGPEGDPYFDIYIGRVPGNTADHLINWLEKQKFADSTTSIAGQSALSTFFFCTVPDCSERSESDLGNVVPIFYSDNPNGYMIYSFAKSCPPASAVGDYSEGYGFHVHSGPKASEVSPTSNMVTEKDAGGEGTVASTGSATTSLLGVNNHDKYPIAYPLEPFSCNFSDPLSIAAGYLTLNKKPGTSDVVGSASCIGATGRATVNGDKRAQQLQEQFFKHIFQVDAPELLISPHSIGWGHYAAKEDLWDYRDECYSYNLFGAPWTTPWLGHKNGGDFKSLHVQWWKATPAPGAWVDITDDSFRPVVGGFYTFKVTDQNHQGVNDATLTAYQPQTLQINPNYFFPGGWLESYNTGTYAGSDGVANVYLEPYTEENMHGVIATLPLYITAVKYRSQIPAANWNTVRPAQYIPSIPAEKIVGGGINPSSSDIDEGNPDLPIKLSLELTGSALNTGLFQIKFGIPAEQHIKISVFDASGREVLIVRDETAAPGWYSQTLDFSSSGLAAGAYFVKLTTNDKTLTRKAVLVK